MKRIKNFAKFIITILAESYFKIRHLWAVWFYFINRKGRKLYRANPPKLDGLQKRLVEDLERTGIAVAHIDELFPGEKKLPILQEYVSELRKGAETKTGKTFLDYLWDVIPVLDLSNPFVKISLDAKILDVVNSYMRMYSRFYYLTLNVTKPVGRSAEAFASQRWHRDPEDKKMLKMFIYINDVDENSGPFMYIPESKYGLKWGGVFKQKPPKGYYPPDGEVEKMVPSEFIEEMTGRAGTIIFCDTSGLHKGGFALQRERIMFTAGYRSTASAWRTDFKHPKNLEEEINKAGLGEKARFAVTPNQTPLSTSLLYWLKGKKI